MSARHTPWPWKMSVEPCFDAPAHRIIQSNTHDWPMPVAEVYTLEDAERILACIQFCDGINTEDLGRGTLLVQRLELLNACYDALNNLPPDGECARFIRSVVKGVAK